LVLPDVDHFYEAFFAQISDGVADGSFVEIALGDDDAGASGALFEDSEDGLFAFGVDGAFLEGGGFLDLGGAEVEGALADEVDGLVGEGASTVAVEGEEAGDVEMWRWAVRYCGIGVLRYCGIGVLRYCGIGVLGYCGIAGAGLRRLKSAVPVGSRVLWDRTMFMLAVAASWALSATRALR